jgi:hypothetical protein
MSRITKLPLSCQRIAGLSGLAASILLTACTCRDLGPVTPASQSFSMPALIPGPAPEGVTISRSGFEGGAFSAVLAVHDQAGEPGTAQVLEEIAPVLRAVGFQQGLAYLAGPDEPLRLEPPDLKSLAVEVCREAALRKGAVCAALSGDGPPSGAADLAIRNAYGLNLAEWKAGLERVSFQYPFSQVFEGVPIEGAGVSAFRREGESVSLVHGSLFNRFVVVNRTDPKRRDALLKIALSLLARPLGDRVLPVRIGEPELVLLPGGPVPKGRGVVPTLRYAWRVLVGLPGQGESWMVWVDADRGSLLRVASQWKDATVVEATHWRRDPGLCGTTSSSCTEPVKFEVDPEGDKLVLRLLGVFDQVEDGNGFKLEVPLTTGLRQGQAFDNTTALCAKQGNSAFRQVNAYSHLYSLWKIVGSAGIVPSFPEKALQVTIDRADPDDTKGNVSYYDSSSTNALSSLWFADGKGFRDPTCPGLVDSRMNGAQDSTVMAHEMSHLFVQRLQERRPAKWCTCSGCNTCPMPDTLGHNILHDFADSFAFSYASTNCFAGWTDKNRGGVDASLACQGTTSEAGKFPREAELPQDRFPEHRSIYDRGDYANGQIAAAGLWEVRKGLRSKDRVGGTQEYWVRLLRSLWDFGFLPNTCSSEDFYPGTTRTRYNSCDRDVFLYLQDLERRMVGEWVTAGPLAGQTVSKVLSGWAKAGLYLVPFQCLDGNLATTDPDACPSDPKLETALDAVIEIDDQDPGDDLVVDGVVQPEVDYLRPDGPPRFQVWTGPHYRFAGNGTATLGASPPCGNRYQVELAADPQFSTFWTNGQQDVKKKKKEDPACWGELILTPAEWTEAQKLTGSKVYYRVKTWDSLGRERFSTAPGGGAFKIDPPFAVINATGRP